MFTYNIAKAIIIIKKDVIRKINIKITHNNKIALKSGAINGIICNTQLTLWTKKKQKKKRNLCTWIGFGDADQRSGWFLRVSPAFDPFLKNWKTVARGLREVFFSHFFIITL